MKKKEEITIRSSAAEYLTYVASVGEQQDSIEIRYEDENIWLTQKMMAQLYDVSVQNIGQHIKKIYEDRELIQEATIKKFFIVQNEGGRQVNRGVTHYNLQMIIAVGFKVNNERAVNWCSKFKRRGKNGIISCFEFDETAFSRLKLLKFDSYSEEWLDFILNCRSGNDKTDYDIVVSGVANDKVFNTVELFFDGLIDKTEAISRLRYEKPNLQICLRSQEAIDKYLHFERSKQV